MGHCGPSTAAAFTRHSAFRCVIGGTLRTKHRRRVHAPLRVHVRDLLNKAFRLGKHKLVPRSKQANRMVCVLQGTSFCLLCRNTLYRYPYMLLRAKPFVQGFQSDPNGTWDGKFSESKLRTWKNIAFQANNTPQYSLNNNTPYPSIGWR